jgi:phosphoserine aminotransferase
VNNTPPTYGIYIAGLVFQWLKRQGGVAAMERATSPRRSCCTTYRRERISTSIAVAKAAARA